MVTSTLNTIDSQQTSVVNLTTQRIRPMSATISQFDNVSELTIVNTNGSFKFMYFDNDNDLYEVLSKLPIDLQNISYE